MERDRAVAVIKQILDSCGCPSVTLLLQPQYSSSGFQIQVANKEQCLLEIQRIAKLNGLQIKEVGAYFILYKLEEAKIAHLKPSL